MPDTPLFIDLTAVGLTDVETGDPLTGSSPLSIGSIFDANGTNIIRGNTLRDLEQDKINFDTEVDLTDTLDRLDFEGFDRSPGTLIFNSSLGFHVLIDLYLNNNDFHRITITKSLYKINQETGDTEFDRQEIKTDLVASIDLYKKATEIVTGLIDEAPFIS